MELLKKNIYKHVIEITRSLLLKKKTYIGILLKLLVLFYCLLNIIPYSYISGFSLFEKLYGYPPNYSSFRVFIVLVLFFILM
jgi:hypothetical protein